jgi:2,3-dihydroxybenzoate decarboxylase
VQDPRSAADELERCVRDLGFCGAMINGHTNGRYLDDQAFDPLWERVETLGTVIYLHPADPVAAFPVLAGHPGLRRATWEWTVETASHALRLVFRGVFDRYPGAQLVLGHLGETLPYLMSRFDSRAKLYGVALARKPSDYIRSNIFVTTSGLFAAEPLGCAINALGAERVMFSSDYPFESSEESSAFIEGAVTDAATREKVCFQNAAGLFKLDHATSNV